MSLDFYQGNQNLRGNGYEIEYTSEQIKEIQKCMNEPIYFTKNYIKIVNLDVGLTLFDLYDFQEEMITKIVKENRLLCKNPRQSGKTITTAAAIVHYAIFNNDKSVAILANKDETAREILNKIKMMIEYLPIWLQPGIKEWNKKSVKFDNGCSIITGGTSSSAIRGRSINFLYLDEIAFIPPNLWDDFFLSVYPTISSSKTSKIIMTSTPYGLNFFYKMWKEAKDKINGYTTFESSWDDIPGRDLAWREKTEKEIGKDRFAQEFLCVCEETLVKVRDKITNEIKEISVFELYKELQ